MTIDFAWTSLASSDREPPGTSQVDLVSYAGEPDASALSLLRGAGLHLDQVSLRGLGLDAQFRVATGSADPVELAKEAWRVLGSNGHAMTIETRTDPIQITELPEVPLQVLVVDSAALDTVQVPIEPEAITDALESACAPVEGRRRGGERGGLEDSMAARADEMVMQEPEVVEEAHELPERSRRIAWATWAGGAPLGLHRAYLGEYRPVPLVYAAAVAGFIAGAWLRPEARRYLFGAAALAAVATWARELIVLRRLLDEPETDAQQALADQRVAQERGTDSA